MVTEQTPTKTRQNDFAPWKHRIHDPKMNAISEALMGKASGGTAPPSAGGIPRWMQVCQIKTCPDVNHPPISGQRHVSCGGHHQVWGDNICRVICNEDAARPFPILFAANVAS